MYFTDIEFESDFMGVYSFTKISDNVNISVVAGLSRHSSPRGNSREADYYRTFEVAFFNDKNEYVTSDFMPDCLTNIENMSRREIDLLIENVELKIKFNLIDDQEISG